MSEQKPKVLVVDDEDGPRHSIRLLLEPAFVVTVASRGDEAVEMFRRDRPDVVTLDLNMPGLSGVETFSRIRELDPTTPVIIVSATNFAAEAAKPAGGLVPFGELRKPFRAERLVETVSRAAARAGH